MTFLIAGIACLTISGALHVFECISERIEEKKLRDAMVADDMLEDWYVETVEKTFNDKKRPRPTLAAGWEEHVSEETAAELREEIAAGVWDPE